jgi:hypothetical protein
VSESAIDTQGTDLSAEPMLMSVKMFARLVGSVPATTGRQRGSAEMLSPRSRSYMQIYTVLTHCACKLATVHEKAWRLRDKMSECLHAATITGTPAVPRSGTKPTKARASAPTCLASIVVTQDATHKHYSSKHRVQQRSSSSLHTNPPGIVPSLR